MACALIVGCELHPIDPPTLPQQSRYISAVSVVRAMNVERDSEKLSHLVKNDLLRVAAKKHAMYMARTHNLSHVQLNGSTPAA